MGFSFGSCATFGSEKKVNTGIGGWAKDKERFYKEIILVFILYVDSINC
jgi:hypothetical protein